MSKRLRSGYTTGACAAAVAKAAALCLITGEETGTVEILFPDGKRRQFIIHRYDCLADGVLASTIKDAGDDPDVTNGAEICATVRFASDGAVPEFYVALDNIILGAGDGVGRVTKPGLAALVGEPAINPVPRQMIMTAVQEVESQNSLLVEISVENGEELAEKTLNKRLGILGGLSILGTTGIVRPISADAWTATISASLNVAREAGLNDVVLSTGRTSERGAQVQLNLPEEAYAMMGDYLEFSLLESAKQGFQRVHLAGMWAKITKAALRVPQTHVRNGALEMVDAGKLLADLGAEGLLLEKIEQANTAREMLCYLQDTGRNDIIRGVCVRARQYAEDVSGLSVTVYLVDSSATVLETV
jgi:cobalt-precorrin-5B (C1)-methyltransferase